MKFSVSETIKHIVAEVHRTKEKDPISPITIISPNISMIQSINRALLKSDRALLNVRIETFYQYVKRHTEPTLLNQGLPTLTTEQSNLFIQEILARIKLKYFHAAKDFPSYAYYFSRVIKELRIGVPQGKIKQSLQGLGKKGEELYQIYAQYLKAKKGLADYADMIETYSGSDETLILFPGVKKELGLLEKKVLRKTRIVLRPDFESVRVTPKIELRNLLSRTQEVKEVFRKILQMDVPLDRATIIAPSDYLTPALEEARQLNIPVFCPHGEEMLLDQLEVFKSVLEVIDSDYDYQALKRFFQLKGHFAPIQAMIDCGVAVGKDILKKAVNAEYKDKQKDRLRKLKNFIGDFEKIEKLKKKPHEMGEAIIDHFIPRSHQMHILKGILEDLGKLVPEVGYETWEGLIEERFSRVRAKSEHREKSIFLTTEYLPGTFDYVFLLGIKEGSFPGKFREDPILLDHERENVNSQTGGTLRTARERNQEATNDINMTIACANKRWYGFFPSMDMLSGKEEFPSFYLIDAVKQMTGKDVIGQDEYQETLEEVRVPWMLKSPDQSLDPLEWSIHHLMQGTDGFAEHILKTRDASLSHFKAHRAYWDSRFNEHSGFIDIVKWGTSISK